MTPAILCVDDDPLVLGVTAAALERQGFRVLKAGTGQAALSLVEQSQEQIVLVLLDWRLPDLAGEELIEQLRQARPGIKLLITSGDGALAEHPEIREQVDGFLQKPYFPADLVRAVKLALKQATRTAAA